MTPFTPLFLRAGRAALVTLGLGTLSLGALAQTTLTDGWARATVAQQKATGAFGKLMSVEGATLVAVASPVAGVAEVHEMAMQGTTMKMRALRDGLKLPAGQSVELKPGGYHLMLMDLKQPLAEGSELPLTLTLRLADGRTQTLEVSVPVRGLTHRPPMMHKH